MLDLSKALTFNQYLEKQHLKYGDIQDKAYVNTRLSEDTEKKIKTISDPVHAVVFTEGFCPDCIVTIPFIQKMSENNENLKVYFLPKTGYEDFLDSAVASTSIPTIITFDKDMNPKGAYVEVPKVIAEKRPIISNDERKVLIGDYRSGKYNDLIEKELLDIIL